MAETIREMSYNSLLKENINNTQSDYSRGYLKGYTTGVKIIIEEIDAIINNRSIFKESKFNDIHKLVKQLKVE